MSKALRAIEMERKRQVAKCGWSRSHDDREHQCGDLAKAAAAYCLTSTMRKLPPMSIDLGYRTVMGDMLERIWPWGASQIRKKSQRRDLVRAGALIVAEIERVDREAQRARRFKKKQVKP